MFVDLQVNWYMGVDFSSEDLTLDDIKKASDSLYEAWTSEYCPTIITSSNTVIESNLKKFSVLLNNQLNDQILWIHLEWPFISKENWAKWCHPDKFIKEASIDIMKKWIDISDNNISIVTLAPEIEGVIDLISFLVEKNITVCLWHHMWSNEQIINAVKAWAKASTHLWNAIPKQLDRTSNPIIDQLVNDGLSWMFITDWHHLSENFIKLAFKAKWIDNFIVTSDSAPIAWLPAWEYHWAWNDICLSSSWAIYSKTSNTLSWSSSNMSDCINIVKDVLWLTEDEVLKIWNTNPKKLLWLT